MIDIAKDGEGVRDAVLQLLEESFFHHATATHLDRMDEEDCARMLGAGPQRTLSPGYYKWAGYLLQVEEMRDCDIPLSDLSADEVSGLLEVRRARHSFNVAHPSCSCGQRLESRYVEECPGCSAKFRRPS